MRLHVAAAAFAAVLASPGAAHAHQPFFADGTEDGAESAFVLEDATISRVVHVDVRCPAGPFWARIDAAPGEVIHVTLGVPMLDELRQYRPTLYLLGPDLSGPAARPPFEIPDGYRAIALPTAGVDAPRTFHEPRTGTDSWILVERRHVVVRRASYYVVVDPPDARGRFWIASGREEEPGGEPGASAQIVPFYAAATAPHLGRACAADGLAPAGGGMSCQAEPAPPLRGVPFAALALAVLLAVHRRRGGGRRAT